MKPILSSLVIDEQAAFIPGRYITDNVFIVHEVLHALKSKPDCAKAYMTVKMDINKAYDLVEWDFVEITLRKQGFAEILISWIMRYLRPVSFSLLINGETHGDIKPTRDI